MDPKALREQANEIAKELQGILKKATDENRELTNEERGKFDELDAKRDLLLADEARALKAANLESGDGRRSAASNPNEYRSGGSQRSTEQRGKVTDRDRDLAFAAWATGGAPEQRQELRDAAARVGLNPANKVYTIRLGSPLRSLRSEDKRAWEERITSGVAGSPDGGGQFTLTINGIRPLEEALLAFGGMRRVAEVTRTDNGNDLPWPTSNDTGNEGAILAEEGEHTELDINFSQTVLEAYKYTSRLVKVSVEYLQDNAIDAPSVIGRMLGERIGRITEAHFTTGSGNSQPRGIMTAATSSGITTATATSITYDNIIDLVHSVDPSYREQGGMFMFNDTTLKILKKIKVPSFSGDTNGQPLWRAGFTTGEPDTIDGFPYIINQKVASGAGSRAIAFGLLSKYKIRDVRDITLVRLDERFAEFGQVGFLAFSRHDGDLIDAGTHPVKYLTMGN